MTLPTDWEIQRDIGFLIPPVAWQIFAKTDRIALRDLTSTWIESIKCDRDRALLTAKVREQSEASDEWRDEWRTLFAMELDISVEQIDEWLSWVDDPEKFKADTYPTVEKFQEYADVARYWKDDRNLVTNWSNARDIAMGREPDPRADDKRRFYNANARWAQ